MKYVIKSSKQYKKDYKKLVKSGTDATELLNVIDELATGNKLAKKYEDHSLKGNLKGKRECHIRSGWLLLYEKDNKELTLLLLKTGDHRHVLGIE